MAGCIAAILSFLVLGSATALSVDFSNNERPITKVLNLLKDMSTQLTKEQKEDEDMYEQLGCWCDKNEKEKTKAIADGTQRIEDLKASIEAGTAKASQLETEIKKLEKELVKETAALEQATGIRTKESAEFGAEAKDMASTIESLSGAVTALGKAQGGAALSQESLVQIHSLLRRHVNHPALSAKQHHVVLSLLQSSSSLKSAQPASGAIFGVLKGMKESFETNLDSAQKDESSAKAEYTALKSAKEAEITSSTKLADSKSIELADTNDKKASDEQDLKDTTAQVEADTTFLDNLKGKCDSAAKDFDARSKTRGEEIEAVSETIGILSSDEAQQSFSKSQSFLQLSSRTRRTSRYEQRREEAALLLRRAGMKVKSASLLKLASRVAGPKDAMKTVVVQIDKQIAELKKLQGEEYEQNEYCKDELKKNAKEQKAKQGMKADLEQKGEDLKALSVKLTEDIAALKAAINEMQVEMKKASELREKENADFQVTVQDQKATQVILTKAMDKLKSFYGFLQNSQPKQAEYKKSGAAGGVMMMIEMIIKESKDVEAKALKAENDAQATYEQFIKDSNDSISAAQTDVVNKSSELADADKGGVEAANDLKATIDELLQLGEMSVALHQECDFLLKNFEIRQSSRLEEIDALGSAKAVLSGAKMFLQQ